MGVKQMLHAAAVVFTLLLVIGCLPSKTYVRKGETKDCTLYYAYIKKNWQMTGDSTRKFYEFANPPTYDTSLSHIQKYINKQCINGLTKRQVVRLFGKPTINRGNRYEYYMREECYGKVEYEVIFGCARMKIDFDERGKVKAIVLPMIEYPPKF